MVIFLIIFGVVLLVGLIIRGLNRFRKDNPGYFCPFYKNDGCLHVDGYLCDINDCSILKKYSDVKNLL
jgi:hypothetical protein